MSEVALAVRILVSLVFVSAALGKLRHRLAWQGVLANYRLMPEWAVPLFALLLPWAEVATGIALLVEPSKTPDLIAAALLLSFAAAMSINLLRDRRHIDCGCFQSALKQSLSWTLVSRNASLVLLLVFAASRPDVALNLQATVEAVITGSVLFVLLQAMNMMWSVVPAWRRATVSMGAQQ